MAQDRPPDDYSGLDDAALVERARDVGERGARDALFARHFAWMDAEAAAYAKSWGLSAPDADDLRQLVARAFLKALRCFDPTRAAPGPDAFRAYAHPVLLDELRHAVRALRRRRAHHGAPFPDPDAEGQAAILAWFPPVEGDDDPARTAERHEEEARLREAIRRLGPSSRHLMEERLAGRTLHAVAGEMGLSDDQAKRLSHQAFTVLAARLRGRPGGEHRDAHA
jgi:RNA polymerase sigma factor (sigma-70 family)